MFKLWIVASLVLLALAGCFLEEWVRSEGGQRTLGAVEEGAKIGKEAAPWFGPMAPMIAAITGAVGTAAGSLAEWGRRKNKKALVSVVAGVESLKLDADLLSTLGAHQNTAGTRMYVRAVRKKVNGAT
ncbi:MAG: hypothetical protein LN413_00260 [Candidatus Thermoplasmatota archaeon]|nr:hypothetical protein [Candidatus Thermoplasmatota archaeon]